MRTLFVINSLNSGGAERSLIEFLPRFVQAGGRPIVTCLSRSQEDLSVSHDAAWEVRGLRRGGRVAWVRELRSVVREEMPALVHTSLFEADVAGRLSAIGTDVPVLTTLVNTSYDLVRTRDPAVRRWKLRGVQAIDGWSARHLTTHFHAITQAVKDAAVRDLKIDPARVTVIERGRDPDRLGEPSVERRIRARRELGISRDELVLVTVGRQEFQKGHRHLVEAMPRILAARPDVTLLLAGRDGHAAARSKEMARRAGLDGRIRFLGHRDDVPELLAAADLFVFPSLYEGLGGALIEAMALGLPIVASDLPAIREVVEDGHNAVLVPRGSADALASAVVTLADRPEGRRRMGERSRRIFEERFTLDRSARRMIELFERVAERGRRRP